MLVQHWRLIAVVKVADTIPAQMLTSNASICAGAIPSLCNAVHRATVFWNDRVCVGLRFELEGHPPQPTLFIYHLISVIRQILPALNRRCDTCLQAAHKWSDGILFGCNSTQYVDNKLCGGYLVGAVQADSPASHGASRDLHP